MEEMTTISIDMFVPEKQRLAIIIQNELSTDFDEVTVEWVDCPDLTQDPFYLMAPGICGDTALLDIGGMSNLFPSPKKEKIYHFNNILQELNRTQSDNFIIGGGLRVRQSDKHLGELIMNTLFSPAADESMTITTRSRFATVYFRHQKMNIPRRKLLLIPATDRNPYCNIYGNFFVSNGLREQVLKIQTKKRFGRDFIDALQNAIRRFPHKTKSDLIGFGGVFVVRNGRTIHHVIRNEWEGPKTTRKEIHNCIQYYKVQSPIVEFATFVSAKSHTVKINSNLQEVFLNRSHVHGYSVYGGGHYHEAERNVNTEYLGYFSPATKLYRIDPVPMYIEMPNFHCL